jgi:hypothetical protein
VYAALEAPAVGRLHVRVLIAAVVAVVLLVRVFAVHARIDQIRLALRALRRGLDHQVRDHVAQRHLHERTAAAVAAGGFRELLAALPAAALVAAHEGAIRRVEVGICETVVLAGVDGPRVFAIELLDLDVVERRELRGGPRVGGLRARRRGLRDGIPGAEQ